MHRARVAGGVVVSGCVLIALASCGGFGHEPYSLDYETTTTATPWWDGPTGAAVSSGVMPMPADASSSVSVATTVPSWSGTFVTATTAGESAADSASAGGPTGTRIDRHRTSNDRRSRYPAAAVGRVRDDE